MALSQNGLQLKTMKFLFVTQGCLPFHHRSLEERPLGGIETGVIRLASELKGLGHEVIVATSLQNPPLSEPLYISLNSIAEVKDVDVFISVRDWQPLLMNFPARKHLFWTGDSYDQPQTLGVGDPRVASKIDGLLTVSDWHARALSKLSGLPLEKCWTIRNGVHLPFFEGAYPRQRRRLIYSSTPYRGLEFLPGIFKDIRATVPDAELHIFSDFKVYAGAGDYPPEMIQKYEQLKALLSKIPGCVFRGNVLQEALAKEFMQSSVLCYPNIFEETSCITAIEAKAAGCPILSTKLGALPETVGECGKLIEPPVNSPKYRAEFTAAAIELLTNDPLWNQLSAKCLESKSTLGWDSVAKRLLDFLR